MTSRSHRQRKCCRRRWPEPACCRFRPDRHRSERLHCFCSATSCLKSIEFCRRQLFFAVAAATRGQNGQSQQCCMFPTNHVTHPLWPDRRVSFASHRLPLLPTALPWLFCTQCTRHRCDPAAPAGRRAALRELATKRFVGIAVEQFQSVIGLVLRSQHSRQTLTGDFTQGRVGRLVGQRLSVRSRRHRACRCPQPPWPRTGCRTGRRQCRRIRCSACRPDPATRRCIRLAVGVSVVSSSC